MITVTITEGVNTFHQLIAQVERGETVKIVKHGRARARIVPDCDFMSGKEFSRVFEGYHATDLDKAAADDIAGHIRQLESEADDALAH